MIPKQPVEKTEIAEVANGDEKLEPAAKRQRI